MTGSASGPPAVARRIAGHAGPARAATSRAQILLDQIARLGSVERNPISQQVDMVSGVDKSRQRDHVVAGPVRVRQAVAIRVAQGSGRKSDS